MDETILIQGKTFEKARNEIRKNKGKTIIFTSNDDALNRKILEKERIDILLLNQKHRRDFQKQRNSGFNQVLAKIAKKGEVAIGINLDEIVESKGKEKAEVLSRINQNVRLCNKNKLKMQFIGKSKRNNYDLKALGLILGMPTSMVKALDF